VRLLEDEALQQGELIQVEQQSGNPLWIWIMNS
jgi:hypothetical protein